MSTLPLPKHPQTQTDISLKFKLNLWNRRDKSTDRFSAGFQNKTNNARKIIFLLIRGHQFSKNKSTTMGTHWGMRRITLYTDLSSPANHKRRTKREGERREREREERGFEIHIKTANSCERLVTGRMRWQQWDMWNVDCHSFFDSSRIGTHQLECKYATHTENPWQVSLRRVRIFGWLNRTLIGIMNYIALLKQLALGADVYFGKILQGWMSLCASM